MKNHPGSEQFCAWHIPTYPFMSLSPIINIYHAALIFFATMSQWIFMNYQQEIKEFGSMNMVACMSEFMYETTTKSLKLPSTNDAENFTLELEYTMQQGFFQGRRCIGVG
jgi:hypothetical protein